MDDLLTDFIAETQEGLAELDADLVTLEQNPEDKELISKIFRIMHTIKGTCGFIGLPRLESIAHYGENILGKFRDGELQIEENGITLILESVDTITTIVEEIAETGQEPDGNDDDLKKRIADYIERGGGGAVDSGDGADEGDAPEIGDDDPDKEKMGNEDINNQLPDIDDIDIDDLPDDPAELKAALAAKGTDDLMKDEKEPTKAEDEPTPAPAAQAPAEAPKPQEKPAKDGGKPTPVQTVQSIRVSVDVLENLMTIASELVLTRNQLMQIMRARTEDEQTAFGAPLQRLNHNVSELQEGIMKTRMQPIGNAWSKLPRIIRDLSNELGKNIELVMKGEETELDRQVLELIRDPLTHMVRNSADHGIENPADRTAAGKPEKGIVNLSAYHEGGHIIIEIKDDGKGLNTERIRDKAVEKGIMSADEAMQAPDKTIHNLIFHPGFSTAEQVTAVSGRGVGMDVVRSNIEKIGGNIDLTSIEGQGSTFQIKIPLTLAIVSALIVESAGERFAIPQINITELVRASHNPKDQNRIEEIKGAQVLRLRDRLLPLVRLSRVLDIQESAKLTAAIEAEDETDIHEIVEAAAEKDTKPVSDAQIKEEEKPFIVVLHVGNYSFGIIVDQVHDMEEIVVKPVSPILRQISVFSGNTILGDGSVVMILDPNGLARATGDSGLSYGQEKAQAAKEKEAEDRRQQDSQSLLLFRAGDGATKAVPLGLVGRLEDFENDQIETADNQHVIQYRGELMPLIKFYDTQQLKQDDTQPVIVFFDSDKAKAMGLIVDEIVDIVNEAVKINKGSNNPGVMGSAIIKEKAMDVIDVMHFLNQASDGDWFDRSTDGEYIDTANDADGTKTVKRVLVVDDSPFFRSMLEPMLKVAGYDVTCVEHPQQALDLREKQKMFDAIISDIEMPGMSGFAFAEEVRSGGFWQHLPMIALSSHATQKDMERGKQAGFDNFVAKFDRDNLLEAVEEMLASAKENQQENQRIAS